MNILANIREEKILWGLGIFTLACLAAGIVLEQPLFCILPVGLAVAGLTVANFRIVFFLLMFSLPFSVEVYFNNGLGTNFPDEPLMWLLAGTFTLFFCANPKVLPQQFFRNPIIFAVALTLLWIPIAVIYSESVVVSLKYMLAKGWYITVFLLMAFLVFQNKKNIVTTFRCIFFPLVACVIIVLFRHYRLNFSFEEVHASVSPIFRNHVTYSALLSMFIPFSIGAAFLTKRFSLVNILLWAANIILIAGVYFSYSRGAWMALFFGVGIWGLVKIRKVQWGMLLGYLVIIAGFAFMIHNSKFMSFRPNHDKTVMHDNLLDHMIATFQGKDISSMERVHRWIAAVRMSQDRPVTGVGPNNFYEYYKPYTVTAFKTWVSRNEERSTTHNYFLLMLTEQGFPAMILYGLLVFVIFYQGQRIYHQTEDRFYRTVVISTLIMFGASFVNNFLSELIESDKIGSLFYMGIALLVAIDIRNKKLKAGEPVPED